MHEDLIAMLEQKKREISDRSRLEVAALDQTIAQLRSGDVGSVDGKGPKVRPGQYRDMKSRVALQAYLNERGGRVNLTRAAHDLATGGVDLGDTDHRREWNLKIMISNNRRLMHYDKSTNEVSLSSVADRSA